MPNWTTATVLRACIVVSIAPLSGNLIDIASAETSTQTSECIASGIEAARQQVPIGELYKAFSALKIKRGEFEPSDQFDRRLEKKRSELEAFIKKRTRGKGLAFFLPITPDLIAYDPDTQQISIQAGQGIITATKILDSQDYSQWPVIILRSTEQNLGSYVGQNAFGVRAEVVKKEKRNWGVTFSNISYNGFPTTPVRFSEFVSLREAKKAKGNLRILVAALPAPPFAIGATSYSSPTLNYRVETTSYTEAIGIELTCAAVVDSESGRVFQEIALVDSE